MRLDVHKVALSEFSEMSLDRINFSGSNLNHSRFNFTSLRRANLQGASLLCAQLGGSNFFKADLSNANLTQAYLEYARFIGANLSQADLTSSDLCFVKLIGANLSGANLTNADLSGADLTGAILTGTKGLGTRSGEIEFAKWLLNILRSGKGALEMRRWHTCKTTHDLAGWVFRTVEYPARKASRMYPTLAKFFHTNNEEALKGLELVASGKLSVFPS